MNGQQKEQWATALESGRYAQGRHSLKRVDEEGNARYCCLGVAAEEFGASEIGPALINKQDRQFDFGELFLSTTSPPMDWMGLTSDDLDRLIRSNDRDLLTFAEIAQIVRELPTTD